MATTVVLRARLEEAELAYHELSIHGGIRRTRDSNGEEVEWTAANSSRLLNYIETLKAQLGDECPGPLMVWTS